MACAIALVALIVVAYIRAPDHLDRVFSTDWIGDLGAEIWRGWKAALVKPWYWLMVLVLIAAERIIPAQRNGGALTIGGAQDLIWIIGAPVLTITLVALWAGVLHTVYDQVLGGYTVELDASIGVLGAATVAFLISDFLMFFTHWVRHKVPTFWHYHAVHHAAPQLNVLTDNRVHFMEAIIAATLVLIPARMLGLDAAAATALVIATTYFTGFTHAAIRTNLGPLRWILVTPQSHRVHHSYAPEHIDKNFGTTFSVWDRLFKTQYLGEDEYPATGIPDPNFPLETSRSVGNHLRSYVDQNLYPFRQTLHDVGKTRRMVDEAS